MKQDVPFPSLYLLVKQLPKASRTAALAKFSLAINSRPIFCRSSSFSIKDANSGSNFDKALIFLDVFDTEVVALESEEVDILPTDVRRSLFLCVLVYFIVRDLANASAQDVKQQHSTNTILSAEFMGKKSIMIQILTNLINI